MTLRVFFLLSQHEAEYDVKKFDVNVNILYTRVENVHKKIIIMVNDYGIQ